jgi:C-terminal processing protease CtpA/Prc
VKAVDESSFGFEINGDLKEHYLNSIEYGSAAFRAGLKDFDKIIKVNNVDVENSNASQLIDLIGVELTKEKSKSNKKLTLTILRENSASRFLSFKRKIESKIKFIA